MTERKQLVLLGWGAGLAWLVGLALVWRQMPILYPQTDPSRLELAFKLDHLLAIAIVSVPTVVILWDWSRRGAPRQDLLVAPLLWSLSGSVILVATLALAASEVTVPTGATGAYLRYVLAGARHIMRTCAVFAFFAAFYFALTRLAGRRYSGWLSRLHFGTALAGFGLGRAPSYLLLLIGPPYPGQGALWNLLIGTAYAGLALWLASLLIFLAVLIDAFLLKRPVHTREQASGSAA